MHHRPLVAIVFLSLVVGACSAETRPPTETKAPAAPAATSTTDMEAAIAHHVKTVKAADVDGVMADYAADAILVSPPGLVTPTGTFVGKDKVREFFVWLATPAVLPGAQSMVTTNEVVGPNTMLFRWTQFPGTPKEVKGYDIFVFRNGKIIFQTTAPNS
jgi:SnoaL-like domain